MKDILKQLNTRPKLFEQSTASIWDDPHISKGMLKAHLNENQESATRKLDFVKKSVAWINTVLPNHHYNNLLDLGCGPGIYAELFYQYGYQVTGIDLSKRSISYAQASSKQKGFDIIYLRSDYTKSNFRQHYDLVTLIYCDFGVLPPATRKKLLQKIYNTLSPKGALLFDVFTPLQYDGAVEHKNWQINENGFWHNDWHLVLNAFYRYDNVHTFLNQYTVINEDRITTYNIWEHTFSLKELERDLKNAGFTKLDFYKDVIGQKYDKTSKTICVIAQK